MKAPSLDKITVEYVRNKVPKPSLDEGIEVLPLHFIYTFSSRNYYELVNTLKTNKGLEDIEPLAIYISDGNYGLNDIYRLINNKNHFNKLSDSVYISYLPIMIANDASLTIKKQELRLSVQDVAFIAYRGDLFVIDAKVTSWQQTTADYGPRKAIEKKNLLLYGIQPARPYLLGMRGSKSYFANSHFNGLGYQGLSSSFGIALSSRINYARHDPLSFYGILSKLPEPTGLIVGNLIENNFFGFYTNKAKNIYLVGNIIRNNIIYNVDPHDFSENLFISRNITYGARHAHGIIISREVNHSQLNENISFNNAGAGLMLDRACEDNIINNNIVFNNKNDGIAIFESNRNKVKSNVIFTNGNNGIYIRNSQSILVNKNVVSHNAKFGIELASQALSHHLSRNFNLDPYQELTSAKLIDNIIFRNTSAAITAKDKTKIYFSKNNLKGSSPYLYGGDLKNFVNDIMKFQDTEGYSYCNLGTKLCD
ncbi:right-handed parallel beta-helix repeat-containing protein [Pseudoalteromonas sp. C2R02]|uniref:right-handed parallel beta-helix repeat-containing protein n=1 Tax=Pseudoalteromonas sp. C2R02 TaxID=2841565 RepID=UPI001C0A453C|nr:right-handed parallel beta-helix repeat-containing protein [Pseudoalteromonas sp. C2R02]